MFGAAARSFTWTTSPKAIPHQWVTIESFPGALSQLIQLFHGKPTGAALRGSSHHRHREVQRPALFGASITHSISFPRDPVVPTFSGSLRLDPTMGYVNNSIEYITVPDVSVRLASLSIPRPPPACEAHSLNSSAFEHLTKNTLRRMRRGPPRGRRRRCGRETLRTSMNLHEALDSSSLDWSQLTHSKSSEDQGMESAFIQCRFLLQGHLCLKQLHHRWQWTISHEVSRQAFCNSGTKSPL